MLRRRRAIFALAVSAALGLAALTGLAAPATATDRPALVTAAAAPATPKPTVVLVHGAFADSGGWSLVGSALQSQGYPVIAFSNPLRGAQYDSEYLRSFLSTIEGPIVLVGHSYGGVLITNAATGNTNVKSLVYIAAYAPDEGESVQDASALGGGHSTIQDHLVIRPFPGSGEGNADAYLDPVAFPSLFAQDLPKAVARNLAATQRPAALAALGTPSGVPAWKTIPSWFLVATEDRIIPPEAERFMAARAGATTVEVRSSHVPMISKPLTVIALIKAASK